MSKRTSEQWATWWAEFKARNGLTDEVLRKLAEGMPLPPLDAPPPPKPHTETDREPGSDDA